MNEKLGIIAIIVETGSGDTIKSINELLHEDRDIIVGRLGIPYPKRGLSLISIVVDGEQDKIQCPFRQTRHARRRHRTHHSCRRSMIETIFKKIDEGRGLEREDLRYLLENRETVEEAVFEKARALTERHFHRKIYVRGLIEFTNYCHNNCYYCGIRRDNDEVARYRLTTEEMEAAVAVGAEAGFQTFVLHGGEDADFTDERLADWLERIKKIQPGCAITLSVGERSRQSYARLKEAGADRFLLRHETYDPEHYKKLHPKEMDRDRRLACLYELKAMGYQVGSGFMVGSPYQSTENLVEDFMFLQKLQPAMIGIGPYVRHHATPFRDFENGSVELTAMCIAILRLLFPT
ncbi:MAG: [FeFe] hydrogenase H-cluster radical SAM maturase HydE, partial [Aedoeadaptatus pacaensis]